MRQVTYAGFPRSFFAGDTKARQTRGQGFQAKWFVVNTKGALVKHADSAAAPAPATTTGSSSGSTWG